MTCSGWATLSPSCPTPHTTHTCTLTHTYGLPLLWLLPLCNIHPLHPPQHNCQVSIHLGHLPTLTPSCVDISGDIRCSPLCLERDLTSTLYSKGHSPLDYLLMERSTSMNRKVGTTHNVKRMPFSSLLLSPLLSPSLPVPCQHSVLLSSINLTPRISVIERETHRLTGLRQNHIPSVWRERGGDITPLSALSGRTTQRRNYFEWKGPLAWL